MKSLWLASTLSLISVVIPGCRANHKSDSSEVRVVGGQFAHMVNDQRSLAHTVSLISRNGSSSGQQCTGILVGPHQIVTAAHCLVNTKQLDIGIGPRYWRLPGIQSDNFMRHPGWTSRYHHDIGIITFTGDLPSQLKPVELATKPPLKSGDLILIAGYGSAGEIHPDVRGQSGFLRQATVEVDLMEPETNTFTLKPYTGKGGCHGDSGGPGFVDREGKLELVGVISGPSSDAPCDEGHGTLVQATLYQGWLKCAFAAAGHPLVSLADDESAKDCKVPRH